jgi:hypothetical protein
MTLFYSPNQLKTYIKSLDKMTTSELNRDIKRLKTAVLKAEAATNAAGNTDHSTWFVYLETAKKEYYRLFMADNTFASLTKTNLLIMIRLNSRFRFVEFFKFGMYIDLEKL